LSEIVLNKTEIKKLDVLNSSIFEPAKIDNYFGDSIQDKIIDFCDRYWNLMHGWKKKINNQNNKKNMMNLFSIGFTQKSAEDFFGLLKDNKIDCLIDVRLNPNGQLSRFAFEKICLIS
jgi:hypothetical protein